MALISNFKRWRNGETFNARDYVYERDTIVNQVNRLSALLGDTSSSTNLVVGSLTATNTITLGGQTISNFEDAGTKIYYESIPDSAAVDSLFVDYD